MAESRVLTFSHREVAEALVKQENLHEGIWGIYIEFGITAANIGSDSESVLPAAIVPVQKIGLQRFSEESSLAVNAAKVNPKPKPRRKPRRKSAAKKTSK